MTVIEDPKLVLKKLVDAEWNATNTDGVTPAFRTGWRDEDLGGPTVTFGPDEESPTSPTGFTGIAGDGSGPTAQTRGTCQIHTWATHETQSANGKTAAKQYADEALRIVGEFYDVSEYSGWPLSGTDPSEYRYIAPLGREFVPDDVDEEYEGELAFHYVATVRYEYLDRR